MSADAGPARGSTAGLALRGQPRTAPETPHEFLGRLRRIPIANEGDAALLTSVYVRARYGDEIERAVDLEQAIRVLRRLEGALDQPQRRADSSGGANTAH